jgi:hypothetical protein
VTSLQATDVNSLREAIDMAKGNDSKKKEVKKPKKAAKKK